MSLTDYVIMPGADYKASCDAVRAKTGSTDPIKSGELPERIASIESGGGGEDLFQYATNGVQLFNNAKFPEGYELTIDMPNVIEGMDRFVRYATGVRKVTLKGNTANKALNFQYAFQNDSKGSLEIVDATEWGEGGLKPTYANTCFSNQKLHTILGEIDWGACVNTNSAFGSASAIEYIRFKAQTLSKSLDMGHCKALSDESIQSIIDGLADLTGSETKTLTLHASIVLTDEQKATITAKNWTLVQ